MTFTLTAPDGTTSTVGSAVTITGDGTYSASTTVLATEVGTYTWHASYSGDSLNNSASDNGQNESLTTVKASPTISTQASETAGGVVGTAMLSDMVTVSGGDNPGGSVTFTLTAPDGTTSAVGSAVTITGDGTYSASTTVLATEVGTYTWHASYSGDSLNNSASDNGQNESLTTVKASPTISTQASETAGGVVGTAMLSDMVTVSGGDNPGGSVTFTLTAPDGTTSTVGSAVTITGDGTYSASTTVLATEVGTYTWHASYSGDSLNNSASDNGQNESLTTSGKATPVITTQASQTAGGVVGTAMLSDMVTVSGGDNPGGSVTFTLTAPDGTTSAVGSAVTITGDGTYSAQTTVLATEVGTYTWHASYSGDSLNNSASDNGQNESLTTVKASPTISSQASEMAGGVVGTAMLSDSATVAGGDNPGGSVTFTITAPDGTTSAVGSGSDDHRRRHRQCLNNGPGHRSRDVHLACASYSGDSLNNGASDNGQNEFSTTVKANPTISTQASETAGGVVGTAMLSDSATVAGGDNPAGSVTFTLTAPDGTTSTVGSAVTITGDGTYSASTTVLATEVGTYTWHASYSGDSLNNSASDNGQNESLTTSGKATPVITTQASQTAGGVVGTAMLSDMVTVSLGGDNPGGSVTFTLTARTAPPARSAPGSQRRSPATAPTVPQRRSWLPKWGRTPGMRATRATA